MKNFVHYGDILAIPCFLIAIIYFYQKKERTNTENFLLLFVSIAFVFDIVSAITFLKK